LAAHVIPGIGPETRGRLEVVGIRTVGDLRRASDRVLEPIFGRYTRRTRDRASGLDERPVVPSRPEKSVSAEETFATDLRARPHMHRELMRLSERTAARLRARGLVAGTVQLKVRQSDFSTCTRQQALNPPDNSTDRLFKVARMLLDHWRREFPGASVRLLGVGASRLMSSAQPDLFADGIRRDNSRIDRAVDEIRDRFGNQAVGRARVLGPRQNRQNR
jgi:DNA polymerase-4